MLAEEKEVGPGKKPAEAGAGGKVGSKGKKNRCGLVERRQAHRPGFHKAH